MPARDQDLALWWNLASDGQLVVDEGGYVLAVNETLASWLDLPANALHDTLASELFTPSARLVYHGLIGFRLADRGRADEVHLELRLAGDKTLAVLCAPRDSSTAGDGWR